MLSLAFYLWVTFGLLAVAEWLETGERFWNRGVYGMGLILAAMCLLPLRRKSAVRALRRVTPPMKSSDSLEDGCFVLYLRNFRVDSDLTGIDHLASQSRWNYWLSELLGYANRTAHQSTREYRIVKIVQRFGVVVAVGNEQDNAPFPAGAVRFLLPHTGWQPVVARDMRRARLVLMTAGLRSDSGSAASTLWEYAQAVRTLPPERFLLLACGDEEDYERFRTAANAYLAQRRKRDTGDTPRPRLPDCPPPRKPTKHGALPPLRGVVSFDQNWTGQFTRFDPTAASASTPAGRYREMVRAQVNPFMDEVERKLPGTATRQRFSASPRDMVMVMVATLIFSTYFERVELVSQKIIIAVIGSLTVLGEAWEATTSAEETAGVKIEFPPAGEQPDRP